MGVRELTVPSTELEALYDLAKEVHERIQSDPDTGWKQWNTKVCLERALYDLWGAFSYTALAEEGKGNP